MPRTLVTPLDGPDVAAAVSVWRAARAAGGREPGPARVARVEQDVRAAMAEPDRAALVVRYGERLAGMALAEPYLADGEVVEGHGHVSMVFVSPAYWGLGLGSALVRALQAQPAPLPWHTLSVWTRGTNRRGLRLYAACGFLDTGERTYLHDGEEITRWEWRAD